LGVKEVDQFPDCNRRATLSLLQSGVSAQPDGKPGKKKDERINL
jgi:hypothetical protein